MNNEVIKCNQDEREGLVNKLRSAALYPWEECALLTEPQWLEICQKYLLRARSASVSGIRTHGPEIKDVAFADIFWPIVVEVVSDQLREHPKLFSPLNQGAIKDLRIDLLRRLSLASAQVLYEEFDKFRKQESVKPLTRSKDKLYLSFCSHQLQGHFILILESFPILARQLGQIIHNWCSSTVTFLSRFESDRDLIARCFFNGAAVSTITAIQSSLSDPHNFGQSVQLLNFEDGTQIFYKPKSVDLDQAFQQLIIELEQSGFHSTLKPYQIIKRLGYGWCGHVETRECQSDDEVRQYFHASGVLLALCYLLHGCDLNYENVVASGPTPFLIDAEGLLHPQGAHKSGVAACFEKHNVVSVGGLPSWICVGNQSLDASFLGFNNTQTSPYEQIMWKHLNTDGMYPHKMHCEIQPGKSLPIYNGQVISGREYLKYIIQGFEKTYLWFQTDSDRARLFDLFQGCNNRFIFRPTRVYALILDRLRQPYFLSKATHVVSALNRLALALGHDELDPRWEQVIHSEKEQLLRTDIPCFFTTTSSTELEVENGISGPPFIAPSFKLVMHRLSSLSAVDLKRQIELIRVSFNIQFPIKQPYNTPSTFSSSRTSLSQEVLHKSAIAIANRIAANAFETGREELQWIVPIYNPEAKRYNLTYTDNMLYLGRAGISIFFAALAKTQRSDRFFSITQKALQPVLNGQFFKLANKSSNLGGATGLPSLVYSLFTIYRLTDDSRFLDRALDLADMLQTAQVRASTQFDVIDGTAGTILGLLPLYKATKEAALKDLIEAAACNLLENMEYSDAGLPSWRTYKGKALTGLAHGASGIALAFHQSHQVLGCDDYLQACKKALQFERNFFDMAQSNWPDFRFECSEVDSRFRCSWCHGAAGIALSRIILAQGAFGGDSTVSSEIDAGIICSKDWDHKGVHQLCCGSAGIAELFFSASRFLGCEQYRREADNRLHEIVTCNDEDRLGIYPDIPSGLFNPGFFQGLSGIGYTLLRVAEDGKLPSILLWE